MGLGAQGQNANSGNRGSSWRYEYNVLKALECIVDNTSGGGGSGCCPETNTLLQQIVDNTNDIEVSLGAGDITVELGGVESRLDTVILNQTNGTQEVHVNNGAGAAAVNIQDGGNSLTVDAINFDIRDLLFATDKVDVTGSTITTTPSGTQDTNITELIGVAPSATNPFPSRLTDGAAFLANLGQTAGTSWFNRITDGVDTALVTAAGELNVFSTAQPGIDIGDVTVNNAAGGSAVNIQDGGNSITVDNIAFSPDATGASSPSNSDSVALVASQIVKASSGTLYLLTGTNTSASNQYIQVHNTTTVPIDTAVPIITFIVQAGQNFSYDFTKYGKFFSIGITVCNSSTVATKTIGSADCWFNVLYK